MNESMGWILLLGTSKVFLNRRDALNFLILRLSFAHCCSSFFSSLLLYSFSSALNYLYSFLKVSYVTVSTLLTICFLAVPCQSHLSLTHFSHVLKQRQQSRFMPVVFPVTLTSLFSASLTFLLSPDHCSVFPFCLHVVLIYFHLCLPSNVHVWWYMMAYCK